MNTSWTLLSMASTRRWFWPILPRPINPTRTACLAIRSRLADAVAGTIDLCHRTRRIAHHQRIRRHVAGHHAARPNHRIFAHGDAADQRRIGADARAALDHRRLDLPPGIERTRNAIA